MGNQRIRELQEAYAVAEYDRIAWALRIDERSIYGEALQAHIEALDTRKAEILLLLMEEGAEDIAMSPNFGPNKKRRRDAVGLSASVSDK